MNLKISPSSLKTAMMVFIQFLCIGILAATGKVIPENIFLLILLISSFLLALWAMLIMKFHFNAAPEVLDGAELNTRGPYRLIRHPMYTSLLGLGSAWIINDFTFFRLFILLILIANLIIKISYEEKFLKEKFPDYSEYSKKTKRLIPFIY
ncbi:MAG: isoprenylcysteine carboxylmethyltransferase family protein [Ignavibacteriae bacterium]|nr:isoprenylcysteine carboxylmethyltransferase family protein [Ignavibacteriota bacterium]